jgi:hypothetical protein
MLRPSAKFWAGLGLEKFGFRRERASVSGAAWSSKISGPVMSEARLIRSASDWVPRLLARIAELDLPDLAVDELAGFAAGSTNRIRNGGRCPAPQG